LSFYAKRKKRGGKVREENKGLLRRKRKKKTFTERSTNLCRRKNISANRKKGSPSQYQRRGGTGLFLANICVGGMRGEVSTSTKPKERSSETE